MTRGVQEVELITQRNAAMVEENNAEIYGLRRRVEALTSKIALQDRRAGLHQQADGIGGDRRRNAA